MKIMEFVETYNESCEEYKDEHLDIKSLEKLYHSIDFNMRGHCKLKKAPEFELNTFGKIIKLYGATIVGAMLILSGTVPDRGFTIVDGKIVPIASSNLIVTVDGQNVTVKAK